MGIIGTILTAIINPVGSVLLKIGMAMASETVIETAAVAGLEKLAASTKSTVDDKIVAAVKAKLVI